ncbi:MAG: ATP-dependent helicase [Acidimicrobiia bacterium]
MSDNAIGPMDWTRAVADTDGQQLVLAGPGAGKTEFLVRRVAFLIEADLAEPSEVLVLAFSRRAAAELRSRVEDKLGRSTLQIPASTFHSFAYRLLEFVGPHKVGWSRLPNILTGPEQITFVGSLLEGESPEEWPPAYRGLLGTRTLAEEVTEFILRANESLIDESSLRELAANRADWRVLPEFSVRYSRALEEEHRIDYGTLQTTAARLLEQRDIRRGIADDYRYVLVDEYQDTTRAQARLLELVSTEGNLTVAADPNQSIYGFRGSHPENVDRFAEKYPDTKRIFLEQSFRVPETILAAADRIRSASPALATNLEVRAAAHSGSVEVRVFDQHSHEAEWIASEVHRLHLFEEIPFSRIAVLVRTKRRLLTELSRALARREVPHDEPQSRLADTAAVRALLDCLEVCDLEAKADRASHPEAAILRQSADAAMARILLGPLFETPLGLHRDLLRQRRSTGASWADVVGKLLPDGQGLSDLLSDDRWITAPATEGFWTWWTRLPQLVPFVERGDTAEDRAAWSSLAQVLDRITERQPATTLLDYARLVSEEDFEATPLLSYRKVDEDRVTLATLHQAKGLQFDVVFVADAVEGVFPDLRRERSILQSHLLTEQTHTGTEATKARLAEEMRLAYVGMTRARRRVIWTATMAGIEEGSARPSRFLPLVAGVETIAELSGPQSAEIPPVTPRAAEAAMRRALRDPAEPSAKRLAATAVLASSVGLRPPLEFAGVRPPGPDRGLTDVDVRLSPSQADLYERCPRRYALSRRLRVGEEENVYARFGSLIHEVLEAVERTAMARGDQHGSLEEAVAELDRRLPDYEFGSPGPTRAWRRRGIDCLESLYTQWPDGRARPISLERELRLELEGTRWLGFADRIEELEGGARRVVDYKTSKRVPPVSELALQLGFYLLASAADQDLGPDVTEAQAWYPLGGKKVTVRELPTSELPDIRARLVAIADGIRRENWQPRPHEGCERCPVRILCPEWPEGQEAFVR